MGSAIATVIKSEQRQVQELEKPVRQLQSDNGLVKMASDFFAMEMNNAKKSRKS
ncbi:hypothetical protein AB6870_21600 [Rahnella inusitata]|uniref:hypothetical protein n=1 Tax=Rahnella inusitata TaxID=58169 RepID=UPI0039BDEDA1